MEKGNKKVINGWTFYDWANSAYALVITSAIFPIYYEGVTTDAAGDTTVQLFGHSFENTAIYSFALSFSYLVISLISPILSGIADYSGNKKSFMRAFCYLGSASCAALYFFDTEAVLWVGLLFMITASIGWSGSLVFYNAYLPEIAERKDHDRISARGYALGYIGSSLLLIFNLLMVMKPGWFGIPEGNGTLASQIAFVTVGVWWFGFAHVTFARLPNNVFGRKPSGNRFTNGYKELKKVWAELKHTPRLKRYLLSFFLFSMGVQTVMFMATPYASKVLHLKTEELIATILLLQFLAIPGAFLFSYLSGKIGNVQTLMIALVLWIGVCYWAFIVHGREGDNPPYEFFALASLVGFVMGGTQSLARSTYAKMLPETKDHASYFSFYDVCEKVGIMIGTWSFGFVEMALGDMRLSALTLMAFFVLGFVALLRVPRKAMTA